MNKYNNFDDVYVNTSSILHILIEKIELELPFLDVSKEVFENVKCDEDEVGYKYYKLKDISSYLASKYSEDYQGRSFGPIIYVWSEQALNGRIYCYGNYRKKGWYLRGQLCGYA